MVVKGTPKAKEKILAAAEGLFLRQGYHGVGTNAIIAESGTSKGSFFYHFPDKVSLVREVLTRYFDRDLLTPMQERFDTERSAKAALTGFIDDLERLYRKENYEGGCLLANMTLELADSDEDVRLLTAQLFDQWRDLLQDKLQGVEMEIDLEDFVALYIGSLQGITMMIDAHKEKARAIKEFGACKALVGLALSN